MTRASIHILSLALLLSAATIFQGCQGSTQAEQGGQDIADLVWRADGSGLVGMVQRGLGSGGPKFTIGLISNDGSLDWIYSGPETSNGNFSPAVYTNAAGDTAVAELGNNIYRVRTNGGGETILRSGVNLLTVSPDLRTMITAQSLTFTRQLITVLDITTTPARKIVEIGVDSLAPTRAIWLTNGSFAVSAYDTAGTHVLILDTLGSTLRRIPDAEVSLHASDFNAATNELYYRQNNNSISKVNLTTGQNSLVDTSQVGSIDVSSDGTLMVYTTIENAVRVLRVKNLQTGAVVKVTNDNALWGTFSPTADRIAYANTRSADFREVKIIPTVRP